MGSASKVLIIDDEEDVRHSLRYLLEAKGYAVEDAADGEEALRMLRAGPRPFLVILDLRMPGMDGWQFRKALLKDDKFSSIPVVLVSAEQRLAEVAQRLKVEGHLRKPVDLKKLYQVLEQYSFAS